MKNNNKILYISIAILVLAIGIAFGTYAYYQTTISGTISGNVAKWSFNANGETSSVNLDLGDLYPGVSNTYYIELSAEDSELDVYYEIVIDPESYPVSSHLYWDSAYTIRIGNCSVPGRFGTIPAGEKISIPLYFNWSYDDYSPKEYSGQIIEENIIIVGQQLTGYTGEIPMEILLDNINEEMVIESINYSNGYIYTKCPK